VIFWRVAAVVSDVAEDTVTSIFKAFMNTYPVIQLHIPEDPSKVEIIDFTFMVPCIVTIVPK